jgi:hypothetical protein
MSIYIAGKKCDKTNAHRQTCMLFVWDGNDEVVIRMYIIFMNNESMGRIFVELLWSVIYGRYRVPYGGKLAKDNCLTGLRHIFRHQNFNH